MSLKGLTFHHLKQKIEARPHSRAGLEALMTVRNHRIAIFLFGIVLLAGGMVPFLRAWDYGLVNLDDYFYVLTHSEVSHWQGWNSIRYFFANVDEGIWMPITWFSFAMDHLLFGTWYGGFHLTSISVHFINSCLVWILLCSLFSLESDDDTFVRFVCLVGALLWAVHPLRCESVVFIASRKDVLSFFWELLALICWIKGTDRSWRWTAFSTLFFIIGSMCKPSVMTFPVLCLLVDFFILHKVRLPRYIVPILYMFFLGAFATWQQKAGGIITDLYNQPLWGRVLGACAAFGIYVRNFVWPQWLAPQCIKTWPQWPRFAIPGILISALWGYYLLARFSKYWNRRRELLSVSRIVGLPVRVDVVAPCDMPLVGFTWFAVAVAPMLGVMSFGFHAFADRFTYIPSVGLSILVVQGMMFLKRKFHSKRLIIGLGISVVLVLMGISWQQTGYWRNDHALFSRTLEVDGDHNACAHGNLANWYFEFPHDLEKCVSEFEAAIRTDIRHVIKSYEIYIFALCELGRLEGMQEKFNTFIDTIREMFGPERSVFILSDSSNLTVEEAFYQNIYYCARIARLITDKSTLSLAGDTLRRFKGPAVENDQIWQYLKWRYFLATGETEKANYYLKMLIDPGAEKGYIRFRYLKGQFQKKEITEP